MIFLPPSTILITSQQVSSIHFGWFHPHPRTYATHTSCLMDLLHVHQLTTWKLPFAGKLLISSSAGDEDLAFLFNYGTGDGGHV